MTFIVGDVTSPVEIAGVHGGRSSIRWKRFVTGNMLHSNLDSFEWAQIPPDGVIGAHVHSRTEEIYFIIRGRGQMTMDDELIDVGPGDLILTPLESCHSFRPTGGEPVEIIVCEMLPPAILERLPAHSPSAEG
jgi:mannose-6-phosphate isomerase-like protein (cupin superfamily)